MLFILLITCCLASLCIVGGSTASCSQYNNCVACTEAKMNSGTTSQCMWNQSLRTCDIFSMNKSDFSSWDDTCPVNRTQDPDDFDFLSNWMGKLSGSGGFDKLTLLDLSFPGTHDTLTYDLSTETSDGGVDNHDKFAAMMHKFHSVVPEVLGDFIRQQAQTQGLNVQEQLDNGVRFLDLRTMFEYSDKIRHPDWYSLHFLQSNQKMMVYLTTIRDWLVKHPTEVVVLWLSKHGSACAKGADQYPNTSIQEKQAFWAQIEKLFDGMLLSGNNKSLPPVSVSETPVSQLIARNARAIFYVTDYVEMTNSSPEALDGCLIDNRLGPSVVNEPAAVSWEENLFKNATLTKFYNKREKKFLLMSMATGVPGAVVAAQGDIRLVHHGDEDAGSIGEKVAIKECTKAFKIPDFKGWCPPTLLDISMLENYYKQLTLDEAYNNRMRGWAFPNAIYLNGVDMGGTIRTGMQVMWADDSVSSENANNHATTKFAYVDTIVAFNLYLACDPAVTRDDGSATSEKCKSMSSVMHNRRAKYPVQRWDDVAHGRHSSWPPLEV